MAVIDPTRMVVPSKPGAVASSFGAAGVVEAAEVDSGAAAVVSGAAAVVAVGASVGAAEVAAVLGAGVGWAVEALSSSPPHAAATNVRAARPAGPVPWLSCFSFSWPFWNRRLSRRTARRGSTP
jgi:hypothetical protein